MKKDFEIRSTPKLPTNWSYEKEVETGKVLVVSWKKKTVEMARFLYKANLALAYHGIRTDLPKKVNSSTELETSSQMGQGSDPRTFIDFCEEIGIPKTTAYRWLASYDPEEDRLLSSDEVKERATAALNTLFSEVHMMRTNGMPDFRPEKWTPSLEQKYQLWLIQNGYQVLPMNSIQLPDEPEHPLDKFGQFGLWSVGYLESLATRCYRDTSGSNAESFYNKCMKYQKVVPKGIKPAQVVKIPILVKAALEDLPQESRKEVALLVASIIAEESGEF